MHDGVALANVGEELVPQAFARGGPFHDARNVHELQLRVHDFLRVVQRCKFVQACISDLSKQFQGSDKEWRVLTIS